MSYSPLSAVIERGSVLRAGASLVSQWLLPIEVLSPSLFFVLAIPRDQAVLVEPTLFCCEGTV
jgi:hypothetical protein